ncbi:hypothetical protein KKG05_05210 [bacterium]|nr:hypothetical protein [bacterium]
MKYSRKNSKLIGWIATAILCLLFVLSCDNSDNGDDGGVPSELVSGTVRDVSGTPLEGVGIHVIYEIEEFAVICPAELTLFEAIPGDGRIILHWQTASELNNDYFEIWRHALPPASKIAQVEGAGNSLTPVNYSYIDSAVTNDLTFFYYLTSVDYDGTVHEYGYGVHATPSGPTPSECALRQNYPNPVERTTNIPYDVPNISDVLLTIWLTNGEKKDTLVSWDNSECGRYEKTLDMAGMVNGLYEYQIKIGDSFSSEKVLLKNTSDFDVLRMTTPGAMTGAYGTYLCDVVVGDSIEKRNWGNDDQGTVVLGHVTLLALKDGYLPADTTLDLTEQEHYTIDFTLQPE